jgi:uncharacterized membrane protein
MPDLGPFHPQVVHFVVVGGIVGAILRLLSLTGKVSWSGAVAPMALIGTAIASVVAAQSGDDAHEFAERIPGVGEAVHEHEELGEYTRDLFLVIGAMEVAAIAFRRKNPRLERGLLIASSLGGLGGIPLIYETAEHGGELVYSYAGGVGMRTGDPADVQRLLVAGLFQQARMARDSGRADEAARLTEELERQRPGDPEVALLGAESKLRDRKDPDAALTALSAIKPAADSPRFPIRIGLLKSEAYSAKGQTDSARAILTALSEQFPQSRWVKDALAKLK